MDTTFLMHSILFSVTWELQKYGCEQQLSKIDRWKESVLKSGLRTVAHPELQRLHWKVQIMQFYRDLP